MLTNSVAQPLTDAIQRIGDERKQNMSGQTIGVIGAGLMGHGIAYLLAAAGHTVRVYDPSAEWRKTMPERLESARALLGGDPALLGRISAHDQMAPAMTGTSFVFEAAPEKLPLKQQLFAELESLHRARHDPRQQQLGDPVDPDRREAQAPRSRGRHAFLESAASGAAGRSHAERIHQRRDRAKDHGAAARGRAQAGARQEGHSGLCRQPAATCA